MILLTRAGWLASAVFFGVLFVTVLNVTYAGPIPFALLLGVAVFACVRPAWALPVVVALIPIAWYSAAQSWNPKAAWAEALVCAALAGLGLDACRSRIAVPRALAAPAAIFGAIVIASMSASLRVIALREGPAFWHDLSSTVLNDYFVDHSLRWLHAGLLLLEGTLLLAHAARLGTQPQMLRRLCAATALGSAAAGLLTLARLLEAASRGTSFWASLIDLAGRLRWNVHYADFNAAGSYFVLALLAAVGVTVVSSGARRAAWLACAAVAAIALWLTSSRIAVIAAPAAVAFVLSLPIAIRGRRQAAIAAGAAAALCVILALVAIALPKRGIQQSSVLAADIRIGLIETGARMVRAYPAYGIGLGAFYERSGEFSSADLVAKFPAAVRENAHNNVLQVMAEIGVAGGLAFVWLIGTALVAAGWRATATRDRFLQFVCAALVAFSLTALAGHPLLVPEAGFSFWILAGAAGGAALGDRTTTPRRRQSTLLVACAIGLVVVTLPLRLRAAVHEADLEHVGYGVSAWHFAGDGTRYREATGAATLFVPDGPFKFRVKLHSGAASGLEIALDGRTADIVTLQLDRWADIVVPAPGSGRARFRRMDIRAVGDDRAVLWLTKNEPFSPR